VIMQYPKEKFFKIIENNFGVVSWNHSKKGAFLGVTGGDFLFTICSS